MAFIGREDIIGADEILHGAAELVLPDALATGLEAFHILTDGVDAGLRNWAEGKANATKVGAPVEASGYLSVASNVNYLTTAATETAEGTMLAVARITSANTAAASRPVLIGTYGAAGATYGSSIFGYGAAAVDAGTAYVNSTPAYQYGIREVSTPIANWGLYIADFVNVAGGVDNLYNMTTGAAGASPAISSGYSRVLSGKPMLIGSGYASVFAGTADMVLAAYWSRVLTSTERATIYGIVKRMAATKGIVV